MKKIIKVLGTIVSTGSMIVGAGIVAFWFNETLIIHSAHADPKPGLWQEQSTTTDGVMVQKIRDTTGGDFNVCYVASHIENNNGEWSRYTPTVSISCVVEKKP